MGKNNVGLKVLVIILSLLVVGLGGLVIAFTSEIKLETMALSAIVGIILNLLFRLLDKIIPDKKESKEAIEREYGEIE